MIVTLDLSNTERSFHSMVSLNVYVYDVMASLYVHVYVISLCPCLRCNGISPCPCVPVPHLSLCSSREFLADLVCMLTDVQTIHQPKTQTLTHKVSPLH